MHDRLGLHRRAVRRGTATLAGLALVVGALVALSAPASAGGNMHVEINMVVVGTAPAGTTFTVNFECSDGGPSGDLTFDASGNPVPAFSNFFNDSVLGSTCTIIESGTGGADSAAFACEDDGVNASCSGPTGNQVTFDSPTNLSNNVTFTITNAYANVLSPLSVSPSEVVPGQQVSVGGTGCTQELVGGSAATGGAVQVTIGFPTPLVLTTTAEGTTGAWSVEFLVPAGTRGSYPVTAVCDDQVAYAAGALTVVGVVAIATTPTFTG